jgi:hypothetical protein
MCSMKTFKLIVVVALAGASVALASDRQPLSYTYVEGEYAIDSAVEIYGDSSDSDNAWSVGGSWQVAGRFVLWGRFDSASYDLPAFGDDLNVDLGAVGALSRVPVREEADSPLDVLVGLSLEHQSTDISTSLGGDSFSDLGLGLRAGVRAGIARHLDLAAFLHYRDYGIFDEGFRNYLDGLFFELGAELVLTRRCSLTATYVTGELDYVNLPGLARPVESDSACGTPSGSAPPTFGDATEADAHPTRRAGRSHGLGLRPRGLPALPGGGLSGRDPR